LALPKSPGAPLPAAAEPLGCCDTPGVVADGCPAFVKREPDAESPPPHASASTAMMIAIRSCFMTQNPGLKLRDQGRARELAKLAFD
jgi:hypothetical protein